MGAQAVERHEADLEPTCGKGLAAHASLPTKLGELEALMAKTLEAHTTALDTSDANAKTEETLYLKLASDHRKVAEELRAIGDVMASHRDLPMARHDPKVMLSPKVIEAFALFVKAERELLLLLESTLEKDQEMLVEMTLRP